MFNVAVCDDMPILAEIVVGLVEKYGRDNNYDIHVDSFLSGEDFLNKFNRDLSFYSLIFLDNKMIGLTGAQTAMIIRQSNSDCPIVFATNDV
jgi:CheY-like chemotaxis protein